MSRLWIFILSVIFISITSNVLDAKKRDDFRYTGKTGDYSTNNDWFANPKKNRRQLESDAEKELQKRKDATAARQRELTINAQRDIANQDQARPKMKPLRLEQDVQNTRTEIKRKPDVDRTNESPTSDPVDSSQNQDQPSGDETQSNQYPEEIPDNNPDILNQPAPQEERIDLYEE